MRLLFATRASIYDSEDPMADPGVTNIIHDIMRMV